MQITNPEASSRTKVDRHSIADAAMRLTAIHMVNFPPDDRNFATTFAMHAWLWLAHMHLPMTNPCDVRLR